MGEYRWKDPKRDRKLGWRRHTIAVTSLAVVAVFFGALGLHLYAATNERLARDERLAIEQRVAAARRARSLEPFNTRFRVTYATVRAKQLASKGFVDDAYWLLLPLARHVRDDRLFRETYREVVALRTPLDARKAHRQHGKEGTGGALAPEDVQR